MVIKGINPKAKLKKQMHHVIVGLLQILVRRLHPGTLVAC